VLRFLSASAAANAFISAVAVKTARSVAARGITIIAVIPATANALINLSLLIVLSLLLNNGYEYLIKSGMSDY
jgi:hypothetical protein